jgi:hypothetical protein
MRVPVRGVYLARVSVAQAFALPMTRELLFTQRLLDLLTDDEVAAVCAHELGHLTESSSVLWARMIQSLAIFPWVFLNPLMHAFGVNAVFGLSIFMVGVPTVVRRLARKMESRADGIAKANEGDAGTYARALLRLYEDNLAPAALAKKSGTHPDLYDRLLAAGMTPDFPRPAPAKSMAWNGWVVVLLAGLLLGFLAGRLVFPGQQAFPLASVAQYDALGAVRRERPGPMPFLFRSLTDCQGLAISTRMRLRSHTPSSRSAAVS